MKKQVLFPVLLITLAFSGCNNDDCYDKQLERKNAGKMCTMQYDPVCGCDGKTYGNACSASQKGITVVHNGPCR